MEKVLINVEGKRRELPYKEHFAHLVKVAESLNFGALQHFRSQGLTYVDVPAVVGITGACENIDTLFKVKSRLGIPLFFAQTGQLSLEQALQSFSAVCTVIHSGRDEEVEDARHLRQFRLTEEEFDSTTIGMTRQSYDEERMYEALLQHIEQTVKAMIRQVLRDNHYTLVTVYQRNVALLEVALQRDFLRIEYEQAVRLLRKNGFPRLRFGDDLKAEHEAKVVALLNKKGEALPVFIMKYPKEIKFFNMKTYEKDPRLALSADLIFPYAGEGCGSAVREHEFKRLNERLITSTMYKLHLERGGRYEDFAWYLNIMKNKLTNPHAGYGIGNDRVMQYIFGTDDIRTVSLFAQLNRQTGDWDKLPVLQPIHKFESGPVLVNGGNLHIH